MLNPKELIVLVSRSPGMTKVIIRHKPTGLTTTVESTSESVARTDAMAALQEAVESDRRVRYRG